MGESVNHNEGLESPTILLCRLHRWRMAFFGLVILLAGMTLGAAVTLVTLHYTASEPPGPDVAPELILRRIGPQLRLSPEQMRQVRPILRKHMEKFDGIRAEGQAQIFRQLRLMNEEISAVLHEDQEQVWSRLMEGLPGQFRHGPWRYGRGPGPGPGAGPGGPFGSRRRQNQPSGRMERPPEPNHSAAPPN